MYKITAIISKPGGSETTWTRYSTVKLNRTQCEALFMKSKEPGKSAAVSVTLRRFTCELIDTDNAAQ